MILLWFEEDVGNCLKKVSVIVDNNFALAAYRQTQGMVIDRGGANSNCRKSVRVDRISIGSANPPNSCLW